ncbi:MAG: hypothetical protein WCU88_04555 [Elusimicrobiota bacterium]|jgi:hypothetical protein
MGKGRRRGKQRRKVESAKTMLTEPLNFLKIVAAVFSILIPFLINDYIFDVFYGKVVVYFVCLLSAYAWIWKRFRDRDRAHELWGYVIVTLLMLSISWRPLKKQFEIDQQRFESYPYATHEMKGSVVNFIMHNNGEVPLPNLRSEATNLEVKRKLRIHLGRLLVNDESYPSQSSFHDDLGKNATCPWPSLNSYNFNFQSFRAQPSVDKMSYLFTFTGNNVDSSLRELMVLTKSGDSWVEDRTIWKTEEGKIKKIYPLKQSRLFSLLPTHGDSTSP